VRRRIADSTVNEFVDDYRRDRHHEQFSLRCQS